MRMIARHRTRRVRIILMLPALTPVDLAVMIVPLMILPACQPSGPAQRRSGTRPASP